MEVGDRIHWLTAVRQIKGSLWEFRCACGNLCQATTWSLEKGTSRSCGCKRKISMAKHKHFLNRGAVDDIGTILPEDFDEV